MWRAYHTSSQESQKARRYAHQQCDLLRTLEDLNASERTMYALDHRKDQVMTACKLGLTNLIMWTRDHYFPQTSAQATWQRLRPFFQVPGLVTVDRQMVHVTLRPFNDRHLTQDLTRLCERVSQASPSLPDGRHLRFTVGTVHRPMLAGEQAPGSLIPWSVALLGHGPTVLSLVSARPASTPGVPCCPP